MVKLPPWHVESDGSGRTRIPEGFGMTIVPHSHVTGDAPITRKMQLRPLDIEQSDGKLALV